MRDKKDDELAALKARIEELERTSKPPAPFTDPDWQPPINPIDRLSMPRSTMREMASAIPDAMVREIAMKDHRAPTGPSGQGVVPSSQQMTNVRGAGRGLGWSEPTPLGPPPGIDLVDAQLIADDVRQRKKP
jgi:hypothetical protein